MNTDQVIENLKVQLQACKETNRESIERILELEEKLDRINEESVGKVLWENHNLFAGIKFDWMKTNLKDLAKAICKLKEGL